MMIVVPRARVRPRYCAHGQIQPPHAELLSADVARDVYFAVAPFLQQRTLHPELIQDHRGPGSLLLTPRLDSQAIFASS